MTDRPTLEELHRRYTVVPERLRRMADGIDPELADAQASVLHWQREVAHWKEQRQVATREDFKRRALLNWDHARAELARAQARLDALTRRAS